MKKSQLVGFVMTFILGPLGLFYSSTPAAVGFLLAGMVLGVLTVGVAFFVVIWPASIITGFFTVHRYNSKVALEERRHKELLEATKGKENGS
jgi:Na+/melibiose symporter-like transporter